MGRLGNRNGAKMRSNPISCGTGRLPGVFPAVEWPKRKAPVEPHYHNSIATRRRCAGPGVLGGRRFGQHHLPAAGLTKSPRTISRSVDAWAGKCQHGFSATQPPGNRTMKRIGRTIIYVMLVIVVLLIIWQFLGSL